MAAVAAFHAIVEVEIVRGAERGVVEAFEPERFAQVLFEVVQCHQMRCQGRVAPVAHAPELLKTRIDEQRNVALDDPTGAIDLYAAAGNLAYHRAAPISGHSVSFIGAPDDLETGVAQCLQPFGERW